MKVVDLNNIVSRSLVRLYHTYSPPLADFIANHDTLWVLVRFGLLPLLGVTWMALILWLRSAMGLLVQ